MKLRNFKENTFMQSTLLIGQGGGGGETKLGAARPRPQPKMAE